MSTKTAPRTLKAGTPVTIYWAFDDEGGEVPQLTVSGEGLRQHVFDAYEVDSLDELESAVTSAARNINERRLGLLTTAGDGVTFHTEEDLLASADGITDELAAGLINECQDIPTICERRRRSGRVFLGNLRHDAEVEERAWVDDLESFIDGLGPEEDFELRLKSAGVWVEPDNISGGI